jgi:hypothetical protein
VGKGVRRAAAHLRSLRQRKRVKLPLVGRGQHALNAVQHRRPRPRGRRGGLQGVDVLAVRERDGGGAATAAGGGAGLAADGGAVEQGGRAGGGAFVMGAGGGGGWAVGMLSEPAARQERRRAPDGIAGASNRVAGAGDRRCRLGRHLGRVGGDFPIPFPAAHPQKI